MDGAFGSGGADEEGRQRLTALLAEHPLFAATTPAERVALVAGARFHRYGAGELVLDAFRAPTSEVHVVLTGQVDVWSDASRTLEPADERRGPGELFGFSAMLTERSVGPRVIAAERTLVAALPADEVGPVFSSPAGARFLAADAAVRVLPTTRFVSYSLVDDLITSPPLVVDPDEPVGRVARTMSERGLGYAALPVPGGIALVTDAVLRDRVLAAGRSTDTPVGTLVDGPAPSVLLGTSAAEAQILLLEQELDVLAVVDRAGRLRGAVSARDFAVSPTGVGVSLHERLRRAADTEELARRARRIPAALSELLARGLATARVIVLHQAMIDTVVRRAIALVFADRDGVSPEAFSWLALGSNGRREAVLSSDVDSAVSFVDGLAPAEWPAYRQAFAVVTRVLEQAGLRTDDHGAAAFRPAFSRSNAEWRRAARGWLAAPERDQGAIMTSLLVDGRPIHGDEGLPAVTRVFGDLREHPGTLRLLLEESLSRRARMPSVWEVVTRKAGVFDVKEHAVLPVVNLARWAGLAVHSTELGTVDRLRAAAGSPMLPADRADTLVEVFEVLQRIRLRYQLLAQQRGDRPTDRLALDRLSPIDRGLVTEAVRTIAAAQRRMDNVAQYVPPSGWTGPR
ncbi:CBS domain-containing protein [Friedmanniella endophytica]|uniref:CBS domain-containing protein n=1 Tax=Microlunatus kandeliicorticis TaxID=1759536 RepID=A0A7W3IPX8_9ACTN|nr:putative nucleotidyltransferase substrate binding domain-containing protein [Microlunatus kandeliicorticis]MBA8793068.1 CBS domain-containing protein [Microlunatus kandeliicorticis]